MSNSGRQPAKTAVRNAEDQVRYPCPACGRIVRRAHFACEFAARGGAAANGEKKRRGDADYYAALGFLSAQAAKRRTRK